MSRAYRSNAASARGSRRAEPAVAEVEEDSQEEDVDEQDYDDQAEQARAAGGTVGEDGKKRASLLIRTVLTAHYANKTCRRADLNKLAGGHRQRSQIWPTVQNTLRETLGMELVEMREKWKPLAEVAAAMAAASETQRAGGKDKGKGRASRDGEGDDAEAEEEQEAGGKKEKGSGVYVLRSVLPAAVQHAMSEPRPLAFEANRKNLTVVEDDSGSLLKWESADASLSGSVALLGVRTIVLCLVLTNNRQISDNDLHAYLRRLGLERDTPLPFPSPDTPVPQVLTLDKFLDQLDRSLYLQKVRTGPAPGPGARGEREDGAGIEWRWGQREPEFSEKAAARFIQAVVFSGPDVEEAEERRGERRGNDAVGAGAEGSLAKRRRKVLEDVEAAAGGALTGDL